MVDERGLKKCPRCSETKLAAGNFYRSSASKDGYTSYCIACIKADIGTRYHGLSPDLRAAKNKRGRERAKARLASDPEARAKRAAAQKEWREKNREKIAVRQRAYSLTHKRRDPERRRYMTGIRNNSKRAVKLGLPDELTFFDWVRIVAEYEHKCAYCGAGECLLDIDHVDPMGKGGPNTIANVAPACRICNAQKNNRSLEEFCELRRLDATAIRARMAAVAAKLAMAEAA